MLDLEVFPDLHGASTKNHTGGSFDVAAIPL
jgi:hypothetical protein